MGLSCYLLIFFKKSWT